MEVAIMGQCVTGPRTRESGVVKPVPQIAAPELISTNLFDNRTCNY